MGLQEELEVIRRKKFQRLQFVLRQYGGWESYLYFSSHYEKMFWKYSSEIIPCMEYLLSVGVSRKVIDNCYQKQLEGLIRIFDCQLSKDFLCEVVFLKIDGELETIDFDK